MFECRICGEEYASESGRDSCEELGEPGFKYAVGSYFKSDNETLEVLNRYYERGEEKIPRRDPYAVHIPVYIVKTSNPRETIIEHAVIERHLDWFLANTGNWELAAK